MINITFDKFDTAFWVSPTNMRHLMKAAIDIDINIGQVEGNVEQLDERTNSLIRDTEGLRDNIKDLDSLMEAINQALRDNSGGSESDIVNALSARVASLETQIGILDRKISSSLDTALLAVDDVNKRVTELEDNWKVLAKTLLDTVQVVNEHTADIQDIDRRLKAGGL